MEILSQMEGSLGVFTLYALILGLSIMSFTFFVNTIRSITITLLGLSLAYYFFAATVSEKEKMDIYMKTLVSSISGSNITDIQNKIKEIIKY